MAWNGRVLRWFVGAVVLAALLLTAGGNLGQEALAHGKEVRIEVSSFTPDPEDPLTRLYRVTVAYASDLDPLADAKVRLTAKREGGGPPIDAVVLEPLNEPGLYAGQITFPLYGSWKVHLSVSEEGEGETNFVEELVPPGPARNIEEVRTQVLELFFRFNWRDVASIVVRISHTLAAVGLFGLTGVILVAFRFLPPTSRVSVFRRLSQFFLPISVISLTVLVTSGIYSAIYSAPVKAPGVFDFDTMWAIPFGAAYLATIGFKVLSLGACGVLALLMARELRSVSLPVPAGGSVDVMSTGRTLAREMAVEARDARLLRLAIASSAIGLFVAVAVVLSIYLHNISHLAVFLPD